MKKLLLAMLLVLAMAFPAMALNTADVEAIAAPFYLNGGGVWGNATGGWGTMSGGMIDVDAYAQGTKSAEATALATGTAFGKGFALGIETPWFGFGSSGAISGVTLFGAGAALGIDKLSLLNNPDYASVNINYIGGAEQCNGIFVDNGSGTYAGAKNSTGTLFWGGSSNESDGSITIGRGRFQLDIDMAIPALAVGFDGGSGFAGGFSTAGYIDTPNFAAACAKTVGFSGNNADHGIVFGQGGAVQQAVINPNGSFGLTYGEATFGYAGQGSLGYGVAETSGWTKASYGCSSTTITSFSHSSSSSTVK
jgi:hypothetical protein